MPGIQKYWFNAWGVNKVDLWAPHLQVIGLCPFTWFADLDLAVPETTRLDSSLHKARAQLLAKGRRHRPSRSRLRDSASSAEDGEGSDGPGGKVGATHTHTHTHTPLFPLGFPSPSGEASVPDI